jgi:hypothetical protein
LDACENGSEECHSTTKDYVSGIGFKTLHSEEILESFENGREGLYDSLNVRDVSQSGAVLRVLFLEEEAIRS